MCKCMNAKLRCMDYLGLIFKSKCAEDDRIQINYLWYMAYNEINYEDIPQICKYFIFTRNEAVRLPKYMFICPASTEI